MHCKTQSTAWRAGADALREGATLAILLSGCTTMTMPGDAGCTSYAEARLARPAPATITEVPPAWANWIADLDDRMTGTCR